MRASFLCGKLSVRRQDFFLYVSFFACRFHIDEEIGEEGTCVLENRIRKLKLAAVAQAVLCLIALAGIFCREQGEGGALGAWTQAAAEGQTLRWVDFTVTYEALCLAYEWDVNTVQEPVHIDWIELLAYLAAQYGGDFAKNEKRLQKDAGEFVRKLTKEGKTVAEVTEDLKYYAYYEEAYRAVLGGLVGNYEVETAAESGEGVVWQQMYGLKAYSPIARGFPYDHYDDFGASRSYGYERQHLGHDMMGQVGTPTRTKN